MTSAVNTITGATDAATGGRLGGFFQDTIDAARGKGAKRDLSAAERRVGEILGGFKPGGFAGGGLTGGFSGGRFSLTRGSELTGALDETNQAFKTASGDFRKLAGEVTPGFGRLTTSRLQNVENQRRRAIGNLRENLGRRRVLGSSFGQDAVTRAELEFSQEADRVEAESFIQELQMNAELLGKANEMEIQRSQTMLNQLNFESSMAAQLSGQINDILAGNTRLHAQLSAELAGARAGVDANNQEFIQGLISGGVGAFFGSL